MEAGNRLASRVVLVRHARPVVDPAADPGSWVLDPSARGEVTVLATRLLAFEPDGVISSPEAKALETGQHLARALGIPCGVDDDLREQGGATVPWIASPEAFRDVVADHFAHPENVVLGEESSRMAADRFAKGVERARSVRQCPVIVTHGRVMCGYLASVLSADATTIWCTLRMPDALVVDFDTMQWCSIRQEEGP